MNNKQEKTIYLALAITPTLLAFMTLTLVLVHLELSALVVLSIAIAILPIISHFRMRRMLASIRTSVTFSSKNSPVEFEKNLKMLEEQLNSLVLNMQASANDSRQNKNDIDLIKLSNEIRRESRYIRLVAQEMQDQLRERPRS
ncbi:hypothetical protein CEPID_00695 [Corynebacterium epidermidicanis]|uniref:Uncharacterized protein n=1 Tax=Corynebacterium epidermidicanis TaxID=1050174 RepID=A0A0G3GR23_9CORY|nr:hypothetical protein CEPID_00695 [Corynebacterium epidermidicanis]